MENLGIRRDEMLLRVHDALGQTGISALRGRAVSTLSGGERQRLALAGILAMQPRLLVLDEPLSQLDTNGAASFMDTVAALTSRGTSVLLAEHRTEQVLARATRVLTIAGGRVQPGQRGANGARPDERLRAHHDVLPAAGRTADAGWALHRLTAGVGGQPVLAGVDIAAGAEVVVLTGPNGSGKTTLLRTIAGLLPPLSGTVERTHARAAYLPQNPTALLHRPTVRAEIEWTLRHESASVRSAAADAMLDTFALREVASRYPRDLSSGQRQRAALAAVLAGAPALALLDEPTRGMDRAARRALVGAIRSLRARGCAVVLATHDRELADAVAARVLTLEEGAVREQPALALA
ncbi:MAG TPA: ABC transporter ATP-binding protein [Candidatus Dormibacteraeota bacterium]|nr:ABC transporter ATP-binding protein [Candidatus Dormibacteraeota bacterium]